MTARQVGPHFLGEHDHPWLRMLLEEHARFIGRPRRELEARLRQERRNCADTDLLPGALVVRFRRRLDPTAVLRILG